GAVAACPITGYAKKAETQTKTAVYLGVKDYGAPQTNKDHKNHFIYRFQVDGKEQWFLLKNGKKNAEGKYDYPIQNVLKEGYSYKIKIKNNKVIKATEISSDETTAVTVLAGTPGEKTLINFLVTALMPMGKALYIYGGGWDWQDEGSSRQACTIGVPADWVRFFASQNAGYTYKGSDPTKSYYPYGGYNEYYYAGLDCSGYLGWVVYNTFETEDGKEGYVGGSTGAAKRMAEAGWGKWTQNVPVPKAGRTVFLPGDIMSINGHVWISLGTCEDGSVLIAHSSPTLSRSGQPGGGVQLSALGNSKKCQAYQLAQRYMKKNCPDWYGRYEVALKDPGTYVSFTGDSAGRFTWDTAGKNGGLKDPEGMRSMGPEEVLKALEK
ncbi:MAG: hypothetical protein K5853_01025, partial [Lachnospiraceae bacterium]|nr:hypothetical protein [Lachnospiraceae bacterium]